MSSTGWGRDQWLQCVATWRESGLTQAQFAKEQKLSVHRLRYWCASARSGKPKGPETSELVELSPSIVLSDFHGVTITIKFPSGIQAEVSCSTTTEMESVLHQVARL